MRHRLLAECGLYGVAALLLVGTAAIRMGDGNADRTLAAAQAALGQVVAAEQAELAAHGAFKPFGPADADLQHALPGLQLPPGFLIDALPTVNGGLHVRAVTRPEYSAEFAPVLAAMDVQRR